MKCRWSGGEQKTTSGTDRNQPIHSYIHFLKLYLSIFYTCFFPILHCKGLLEPIRAGEGREAGTTLDRSPAYRSANSQRQTFILTDKRVFELWEETGVSGENPRMCRENMQTPHRKARAEIQTPNPLVRLFYVHKLTHTNVHTHTKPVIPATWKTPDYHLLCLRWALVGTLQADRNWNPLVQWKTMTEISHTIHLHKSHKCAIITNKFKELLINEKTIRRCFLLVKLLIYLRNWTNLQTKHFGQKKVLRTLEDFTLFVSTLKWLETWYESPP